MAKAQTSKPAAAAKPKAARQTPISPAASTPQADLPPEVLGVFPPVATPPPFVPFLPVSYSTPAGTPDLRAEYVLPPPVIVK